jgi:hypothetical protein
MKVAVYDNFDDYAAGYRVEVDIEEQGSDSGERAESAEDAVGSSSG